ncbi:MAG: phosphotransferase family protein [Candidatus Heimdallarchaeota archaeon]
MTDSQIKHRLLEYYKKEFPQIDNISIPSFERFADGWETEIYAFTFSESIHPKQDLILRIYPGKDAEAKSKREFSGMVHLKTLGYPVPEVYHYGEQKNSPFSGKPFCIMERIFGGLLGDSSDPSAVDLFASLLVQLHELKWRKLIPYVKSYSPIGFLEKTLDKYRATIRASGFGGFLEPISWIQEEAMNRDLEISLAITHNDFHPYNIILDVHNRPYVIDWSGFAISDYRMDLAWALMLIEAYRTQERRLYFKKRYAEISMKKLEHLDLFDVMACTRRLFDIVVSIEQGPDKLGMRPEALTVIIRDLDMHKRVYRLFQERSRLSIPEVEALIAKLEEH